MFGIANTFASLSGFLGNILASFLIKQPILSDWRKTFIPFIVIYIIGGVVFLLYGSAEPLKWAKFPEQSDLDNDADESMIFVEKSLATEESVTIEEKI